MANEEVPAHKHADLEKELAALKKELAALKKELAAAKKVKASGGADPRVDKIWESLLSYDPNGFKKRLEK
jgi:ribosomal protein L29